QESAQSFGATEIGAIPEPYLSKARSASAVARLRQRAEARYAGGCRSLISANPRATRSRQRPARFAEQSGRHGTSAALPWRSMPGNVNPLDPLRLFGTPHKPGQAEQALPCPVLK